MEFRPLCDICGAEVPLVSCYFASLFSYEEVIKEKISETESLPIWQANLCNECKTRLDTYIRAMRLSNDMKKEGREDVDS